MLFVAVNTDLPFVKHFFLNYEIDFNNKKLVAQIIQKHAHVNINQINKVIIFENNKKIAEIDF